MTLPTEARFHIGQGRYSGPLVVTTYKKWDPSLATRVNYQQLGGYCNNSIAFPVIEYRKEG